MTSPSDDARFAFECPRRWSALTRTTTPDVRYCGDCAQTVHLVTTTAAARRLAVAGRCVALAPTERPGLARRVAAFLRAIVHGRDPVPPERIPDPPPEPPRPSMKVGMMVFIDRDAMPPTMGWLVEISGERRGTLHVIRDGDTWSGDGARIVGTDGSFLLVADDGAAVRVNDRRVTRHELADGERVALAGTVMIWKSL